MIIGTRFNNNKPISLYLFQIPMNPFMIKKFCLFLMLLVGFSTSINAQFNTEQVMANGRNALYFEDYVLSIQYFNKVISAKPYLAEPYFLRAYAKYNLDDLMGAKADCEKTISINPYYVDAYNLRGIINQRMGQNEKAISDYQAGLEIMPNNVNLLSNCANSYLDLKQYDKAIESYNQIIKAEPGMLYIYINRGIAYINAGDTVKAINDFSHVIDRNPYMVDAFWCRAIVYSQKKEYQNALGDYNKAIKLRPREPNYYINRGITRYQLDDLRGAMDDLNKALELEPKNASALLDRGLLRAEVGDLNRAVEDFSRVLALNPSDEITLYNRALINIQLGEFDKSLADLNIIIENHPEFGQAYNTRSHVKQMLNDERGAQLDYNTAMKLEMDRRQKQEKEDKAAALAKKNGESQKESADGGKKETRSEKDKDISNYNKIAVLDDFETNEKEEDDIFTTIRGKIQHRDIFVDVEPSFGILIASQDSVSVGIRYFDKEMEQFNRKKIFTQRLQLSNKIVAGNETGSLQNFYIINEMNDEMNTNGETTDLLFARGIMYILVSNYTNAIADFNKVISKDKNYKMAYFNRALVRLLMLQLAQKSQDEEEQPSDMTTPKPFSKNPVTPTDNRPAISSKTIDYGLIYNDLDKVLELDPTFSFAYYNRAVIKCMQKDFNGGMTDFSKAIELNADFGEAYYNRGLIHIYQKEEDKGIDDLSKAGELGVFKAYNVIKRYSKKPETTEGE